MAERPYKKINYSAKEDVTFAYAHVDDEQLLVETLGAYASDNHNMRVYGWVIAGGHEFSHLETRQLAKLIKEDRPNAALVDARLPGFNDLVLAQELIEIGIPTIVFTAAIIRHADKYAAVIRKPAYPDEILEKIKIAGK